MRGAAVICWRPRLTVADRRGRRVWMIFLMLTPVRVCASRETARAVNTMVRWASIASRVRANIGRAGLDAAVTAELLARLDALDDGTRLLCHGDLNAENVMLTARGPVAIDWLSAVTGPPAAICRKKSSSAEPREPRTFPKRTLANVVARLPL